MNDCEQFKGRLKDLCLGRGLDGRPNPPRKAVRRFREQHGIEDDGEAWSVSQPSRGLGDVVAKIMHATGIAKVVEYVSGKLTGKKCGCGCKRRQDTLNAMVPFTRHQP